MEAEESMLVFSQVQGFHYFRKVVVFFLSCSMLCLCTEVSALNLQGTEPFRREGIIKSWPFQSPRRVAHCSETMN